MKREKKPIILRMMEGDCFGSSTKFAMTMEGWNDEGREIDFWEEIKHTEIMRVLNDGVRLPRLRLAMTTLIALMITSMFFGTTVLAETSSGIAQLLVVSGEAVDGTVICVKTENSNVPCDIGYDPNMIGVVTKLPAITFGAENPAPGTFPIASDGKAFVIVSGENGPIKKGDFVTSSTTKGVAVKAQKSGYVLGTALEDFNGTTAQETGKIEVSITIKPAVLTAGANANLVEVIKQGMESAFLSPLSALRYVVAGLVVLISVIYGFFHFGKLAKAGVDAVGRNPLASKAIQLSVLFNVILTVGVIGVGVGIAYLVLSL